MDERRDERRVSRKMRRPTAFYFAHIRADIEIIGCMVTIKSNVSDGVWPYLPKITSLTSMKSLGDPVYCNDMVSILGTYLRLGSRSFRFLIDRPRD